ncbi:MAG: metal ABC transporter substrate-binding protein [Prosthecobacter sp.]|nr:metal ABC transporter substrate-binding protein [Prosthecobacter sp.]
MRPSLLLLLPLLLVACKPAATPAKPVVPANGKPTVMVANYPLQYFTQRLAGDTLNVTFPAPADEDPAFWQPDDTTVAAYQNADLIVMNGAAYSKWAEKASLPASKLVDTSAAFKAKFIEIKDTVSHSHGPGGEHSHAGTAFTTWVDFQQAQQQAQAIREALQKKWPALAPQVSKNFESLEKDLQALDARLEKVGKRIAAAPLVASHPVYHYLARRYGLNLQSVLWEPEVVPDDKAMTELKSLLVSHPARWMLWEGDPAAKSVAKLDAIGLKSLVFDPCGNVPEKGDFLSVMNTNVEALEKAFP